MNGKGIAKRGDKKIPTRVWNRMVRAVATIDGQRFPGGGPANDLRFHHSTILIKNDTGQDIPAWNAVAISGMAVSPSATGTQDAKTSTFVTRPVASVAVPSSDNDATFVVALKKIPSGKVGVAACGGVVPAIVEITHASDRFVATKSGSTTLKTGPAGEAAILWKQDGTGSNKWALIRLGQSQGVVRGTFTAPWGKGGSLTVTANGSEYTAKNYFVKINGSGTKNCAIARAGSEWILIAAEC